MSEAYTPRPYQELITDHIIKHKRCAIFASMGSGKTSSTLTALSWLMLVETGKVLVVAPLRVATSTWPDEVLKWDHLADLSVSAITGCPAERRQAVKADADIYTINFENLPWLAEQFGDEWPFTTVVIDESTKLKGFRGSIQRSKLGKEFLKVTTGTRAKALAQVAHKKVNRIILLTGTPAPNGLQDLWGQHWFVDAGKALGRSFEGYKGRWFQSIQVGSDRLAVQLKPLPFAQSQIEDRLRETCLTIDVKDYLDISEPIVNVIRVKLPKAAQQIYKDMEKELYAELQSGAGVEAVNAAARTVKCLQIANGALYIDDKQNYEDIHDAKLQALESIIEEAAGAPVLVAYHFKSDLARLLHRFRGSVALTNSPDILRRWNEGSIPILFAHPASAGHGLNLQHGGNTIIFFGHWWNLEEHQQIIERIGPVRQKQSGYDRPVFIHHIVAEGTLDEVVMARRESKREVQDLLLEALKKRYLKC